MTYASLDSRSARRHFRATSVLGAVVLLYVIAPATPGTTVVDVPDRPAPVDVEPARLHPITPRPHTTPRAASRQRRALPRRHTGTLVSSTAYCLTGTMADGTRVDAHPTGTVAAGNRWPLGTRLRIVELDRTVTIRDRIGHGSDLDLAYPGDCHAARRYGRHAVHVIPAN